MCLVYQGTLLRHGGTVDAMLFWLIAHSDQISVFNLIRYIILRAGGATATAFLVVVFFGPLIRLMNRKHRGGAPVRVEGASSQVVSRNGTPALDALTLLSAAFVSTMLWANLRDPFVWIAIGEAMGFALIGFHDGHHQMTKRHGPFSRRIRLLSEMVIATGAWIVMFWIGRVPLATSHMFDERRVVFGFISLALSSMVVVGAANAVKLIDTGDRSLAAILSGVVVLGIIVYLIGPVAAGPRELTVVCAALVGLCLGLVWFKTTSTPVFLGDTGSLALGATLGTIVLAIL